MTEPADAYDCVYATGLWQDADERAMGLLLDLGWRPIIVSLGRDVPDAPTLRAVVGESARGGLPVIASASLGNTLTGVDVRLVSIAPSVDLEAFPFHAPWIDAFLLGVPPHAHLVLSLRAHRPESHIEDIVAAFAQVERRTDVHEDFPDPHLLIGHAGPETDALQDAVRAAGVADRTRFLGMIPSTDLVPLLGRGSCFVTASTEDVLPSSVLQAMACGTPVIAVETPAVAQWIEDGVTGYLVPAGDVDALADVLRRTLATYPTDLVLRARARVEERADWTREAARLTAALASA